MGEAMRRIKLILQSFNVKTIITLAIIATLCFLAIRGDEIPAEFLVIASAVVTYYFCKDGAVEDKVAEHEKNYH